MCKSKKEKKKERIKVGKGKFEMKEKINNEAIEYKKPKFPIIGIERDSSAGIYDSCLVEKK